MNKDNTSDELVIAICEIFGIFPEELEHNLPNTLSVEKMRRLQTLITQKVNEAERRGRIDELERIVKLPGHYGARDYDMECHNRIKSLQSTQEGGG